MTRVAILDYGVGNLRSVQRAFAQVGAEVASISTPAEVAAAEHLVLPGVGAFSHCAEALHSADLWEPIRCHVTAGRALLGICVGMQLMLEVGEEFGEHAGFGFLPGRVRRLPERPGHKIPFVGWKAVQPAPGVPLFTPGASEWFYFVHSFAADTAKPGDCLAQYDYGGTPVTAAIGRDRMIGTQFHPEKSAAAGLGLLRRFLDL